MSFQMKILYFRNGQTSLKIFIMLKPMRISMTNFTTKFCLKKTFLEDGMLDPLYEQNPILNVPISHCEVKKVVNFAKNGKSSGFDKIPYEVLKFPIIIDVLHALFSLCLIQVFCLVFGKKL